LFQVTTDHGSRSKVKVPLYVWHTFSYNSCLQRSDLLPRARAAWSTTIPPSAAWGFDLQIIYSSIGLSDGLPVPYSIHPFCDTLFMYLRGMSCCLSRSATSGKRHSNQYSRSESWWRPGQTLRQLCFVSNYRSCSLSTSCPCGHARDWWICAHAARVSLPPTWPRFRGFLQASMDLDTSFSFCSVAFLQLFKHERPLKRTSSSVATASLITRCQERILLRLEVLTDVVVLWASVMRR
jgi:hypothetical protein